MPYREAKEHKEEHRSVFFSVGCFVAPRLSKPRPSSPPTDWGVGKRLTLWRPLPPLPLSKPQPTSPPTDWGVGRSLWRPLLLPLLSKPRSQSHEDPSCCRCCQSHDRPAFLRIGELEEAYGDPSCSRCRCQSHDRAFLRTGELEEACGDPSCCARGNHPMAHPESWGDA